MSRAAALAALLFTFTFTLACGAPGAPDAGPGPDAGVDPGGPVPDTGVIEAPPARIASTTVTFRFVANVLGSEFECRLDQNAFAPCTSPHTLTGLAEGPHEFAVRAIAAGQVDPTPALVAFAVDFTPPETTIGNRPAAFTRSTGATFAFSSSESGGTFRCSVDGATAVTCTSPRSVSKLAEGEHVFEVSAIDLAGNVDPTPARATWVIDATPPDTAIDQSILPTGSSTSATFFFSSTEPGATFQCSLNAAGYLPCTSPFSTPHFSAGAHAFAVRAIDAAANLDASPATAAWTIAPGSARIRAASANLSSGNLQSYDPGEGIRIFQGLVPDVVLIQEFKYRSNLPEELREFVDLAFGPQFVFHRESGVALPNGIISRYPILDSGSWDDPLLENREFAWARLDVPGAKDLWVISVHFLTTSATSRATEAEALVDELSPRVPAGDYLLIGGDFNTNSRGETAITTLSQVVVETSPYPVDQHGNSSTNAPRDKPYDWLLADPDLHPLQTPVVIGGSSYPNGLVFDSRVYTPLVEVTPVLAGDSGASNMQHMAVVKDFLIPY